MKPVQAIQQHAIDRYLKRSGAKSQVHALNKLFELADKAIPIGRNRFYHKGWIIVVVNGLIKTTYKPKRPEQLLAVYEALNSAK